MPLRWLTSLLFVAAAASLLCACSDDDCADDAGCSDAQSCVGGRCVVRDPAPAGGTCRDDSDCASDEICWNHGCADYDPPANPTTCPEPSLEETLVCSQWDAAACPCQAGEVSFREKEIEGRLSCAGVVGIFSDRVRLSQVGCALTAQGGELEAELVGADLWQLRIAQLPNATPCEATPDRWSAGPDDEGRPAVRLTCSPTCTIWMEQWRPSAPEQTITDGSFEMGTPAADAGPESADEQPAHLVDVTCFSMDRFEVTRADYDECMDAAACEAPDYVGAAATASTFFGPANAALPITWITHRQAEQYCRFRDKALPTEAEWERAARGSREAMTHYPWGDDGPFSARSAPDCAKANFAPCSDAPLPATNAGGEVVRPDGASFFGVVDLAGNVREWTRDYYRADAYGFRADLTGEDGVRNPEQLAPDHGLRARVVRGGSFLTQVDPTQTPVADALRASDRDFLLEDSAAADVGLRCVRYKPGVPR